jgi:ankyrin repeat protein
VSRDKHSAGEPATVLVPPLSYAVVFGNLEMARLLLQEKADINRQDELGRTPLHWAVLYRHEDMVKFLLTSGANVNKQDGEGFTPWLLAVRDGKEILTQSFIEKGADVNVRSKDGHIALLYHMSNEHLKLLLANKADPNLKGPRGYTVLHAAAATGDLDRIKLLLANGADVNSRDADGNTPLHYVALLRRKEVVELLLENKADPNIINEAGESALALTSVRTQITANEWGIPVRIAGPNSLVTDTSGVAALLRQRGAKE